MSNLVPRERAMAYTGHRTPSAFYCFIWRINRALPADSRVVRTGGRYDLESLKNAVAAYSRLDRKAGEPTSEQTTKPRQCDTADCDQAAEWLVSDRKTGRPMHYECDTCRQTYQQNGVACDYSRIEVRE